MGWKKTLRQWEENPQSIVTDLIDFLNKESEKNRRTSARYKTLTLSDIEQLAEKFRVDPAYIQKGILEGRIITNEDFFKELELLRPGKVNPNLKENLIIDMMNEDGYTNKEIAEYLSKKGPFITEEAVKKRLQRRKK